MTGIARVSVLTIAIALIAACSRPNLQSTGGGYGPGAAAPAGEQPASSSAPEDGGAAGTSGG